VALAAEILEIFQTEIASRATKLQRIRVKNGIKMIRPNLFCGFRSIVEVLTLAPTQNLDVQGQKRQT